MTSHSNQVKSCVTDKHDTKYNTLISEQPYIHARQLIFTFPGQNEPRPGHGTPWVNSGTILAIPGRLATLVSWFIPTLTSSRAIDLYLHAIPHSPPHQILLSEPAKCVECWNLRHWYFWRDRKKVDQCRKLQRSTHALSIRPYFYSSFTGQIAHRSRQEMLPNIAYW